MYHLHIQPNDLNDDDYAKAFVGVQKIIAEKNK